MPVNPIAAAVCIATHCLSDAMQCASDAVCRKTGMCMTGCTWDAPGCYLNCEVRQNADLTTFTKFSSCMFKNECQPQGPLDGECRVTKKDGQKNLTSVADIAGSWWVTKGVNPHYDSFPCQHNRYIFDEQRKVWVNNVTWLDTFHEPKRLIGTIPVVNVTDAGVFMHYYDDLDQIEPWTVISKPHPDYMMMLWCGENPALKYAGGILLARDKDYHNMPKWVEEIFRREVNARGLDFDNELFINDNSQCEEDPPQPCEEDPPQACEEDPIQPEDHSFGASASESSAMAQPLQVSI
mmetsp:Transcript_55194/g.131545  ORF Transcript_55194/g.131545 Transcript_55194/m.131545 type:complete len:294 (+) Transcript_55194:112-993(+)